MADPTLSAIDRFFDLVDNGVEAMDRVLNRSKHTDEQLKAQAQRSKRREIIDAEPVKETKKSPPSTSTSTAIAKRPHFRIVEAVDKESGKTIFVVTDGGNARAECNTREVATKILRALEKAS